MTADLIRALTEVLEFQSAPTGPTIHDFGRWRRVLKAAEAGQSPAETHGDKWEGAEEWMPLAWELCANECGEEACTELVWEGGPIPEPWGDRWLKYEDQAKEMIAMVRKHVRPQPDVQPKGTAAPGAYDRGVITGLRQAAAICADREDITADRLKAEIEDCIANSPVQGRES